MGKGRHLSSEIIAAYLDGNATASETMAVLDGLASDPVLRELMRISDIVDGELEAGECDVEVLPISALAANSGDGSLCSMKCEQFVLDKRGILYDSCRMMENAVKNKWSGEGGTALHNVGRNLEYYGLSVSRRYKCSLEDMVIALKRGDDVIVAVDGGELLGNREKEHIEDVIVGHIPDHIVVVLSCEMDDGVIALYDPDSINEKDEYPLSQFTDAWEDSKNYMLTINTKDMKEYVPCPIDLSDVVLADDLNELREAIAENAHEIWAENRQKEGWTYGPQRDDKLKQTPDMVPYSQLPDSEKEYDREMAMKTIKLLKKLGYDLIKREDTELYRVLRQRIRESDQEFYCRRCGNVIYKHQVFCDRCGLELNMDWKEK